MRSSTMLTLFPDVVAENVSSETDIKNQADAISLSARMIVGCKNSDASLAYRAWKLLPL